MGRIDCIYYYMTSTVKILTFFFLAEASTAKVIVAATQSDYKGVLYEIDMNGQHVNDLTNLSFWNRHLIGKSTKSW